VGYELVQCENYLCGILYVSCRSLKCGMKENGTEKAKGWKIEKLVSEVSTSVGSSWNLRGISASSVYTLCTRKASGPLPPLFKVAV